MTDITRKALELYLADEEKILASLKVKQKKLFDKQLVDLARLEYSSEEEIQEAYGNAWITDKKRQRCLALLRGAFEEDPINEEYIKILELNLRQMRQELRYD